MSYFPNYRAPVNTGSISLTSVPASASAVVILSGSYHRVKAMVFNHGSGSLYLRFGPKATAAATVNSFSVKLSSGSYYEFVEPIYIGEVNGIWDEADGFALVTQLEYEDVGYP